MLRNAHWRSRQPLLIWRRTISNHGELEGRQHKSCHRTAGLVSALDAGNVIQDAFEKSRYIRNGKLRTTQHTINSKNYSVSGTNPSFEECVFRYGGTKLVR